MAKRIKRKWHFTLGDFKFKKATYHPNRRRSFEVWYKNDLIGNCFVNFLTKRDRENGFVKLQIFKTDMLTRTILGDIYCKGEKNGFPTQILSATLFPNQLDMIFKRKILIEKCPEKHINNFISPSVYITEHD